MSLAEVTETVQAAGHAGVPRAPAFIVTLYGDAIEPRGGTLWMGDLVTCCAQQGISESLVRTAVSRLVAAGKLLGERIGRKSYYRLTEPAQTEFKEAARVLYAPPPQARGWLIAPAADEPLPDGWALMGQRTAIAPNRDDITRLPGPLLSAETIQDPEGWPKLAADLWELDSVAERYLRFLSRFKSLASLLGEGAGQLDVSGDQALALRLQLVHHYRLAALRDPRLPREALPARWPGVEARRLFVTAYLALADAADAYVGRTFRDSDGLLLSSTETTGLRLDRLAREASLINR